MRESVRTDVKPAIDKSEAHGEPVKVPSLQLDTIGVRWDIGRKRGFYNVQEKMRREGG